MTMTNEHVGMYIRLLCLQHQKGRLTDVDMKYICNTYVEDVYKKFIKEPSGLYYNQRMEDETNKRVKYSDSRRKNIQKRYNTQKSTYVVHMENENENEDKNENGNEKNKKKTKGIHNVIDLIPEQIREDILQWYEVRVSRRNRPTENAIKLAMKRVFELSKGDMVKASKIIQQSTINGWAGFFPIKDDAQKKWGRQEVSNEELIENMKEFERLTAGDSSDANHR